MVKSLDVKVVSAHLITIILWGSAFPGIRAALTAYSPVHISLLRLLVASMALIMVAVIKRIHLPEIKDVPVILLLGFLGFSVYHTALNFGEQTINAGAASLIVSITPIFTALLALLFFKEKFGVWGWIGSLIGFAGVAFISLGGSTGTFTFNAGVFLVLLAAFSESFYFVFQNNYLKKYGSFPMTIYTIWSGTIFMLIFLPGLGQEIMNAPMDTTLVVIYLGIFPTVIPYFMLAYVTSRTGASEATSSLYLTPVFAFLIAWVWLNEEPHILAIVGGVITISGVLIANLKGGSAIERNPST